MRAFRETYECNAFALYLQNLPQSKQVKFLHGELLDRTFDEAVTAEQCWSSVIFSIHIW